MRKIPAWLKIILAVSIFCNILFLLPYTREGLNIVLEFVSPTEYFAYGSNDTALIQTVTERTMQIDGTMMVQNEYRGLFTDIKNYFKPKRNSKTKYNYYKAYSLAGLSYQLTVGGVGKNIVKSYLCKIADNIVDETTQELNYPLTKVDQIPIGIVFVNLYKSTGDRRYLKTAEFVYQNLLGFRKDTTNIIYYIPNAKANFSDAVGMYVPFLMEYYHLTKDSLALRIAEDNMAEYYRYGIDKETGIPAHGYSLENKLKVGSANWGRGVGWYLLAASYCPFVDDSLLNNSVMKMDYTQFPGSSSRFDSSTALMFEIYKKQKGLTRKSLDFIKPFVTKDGMVDSFSGDTYGLNDYSHKFSESELGNGLLLMYYCR